MNGIIDGKKRIKSANMRINKWSKKAIREIQSWHDKVTHEYSINSK